MKRITAGFCALLLVVSCAAVAQANTGTVFNGTLDNYGTYKLGEMYEAYFSDTSWLQGTGTDGYTYVCVRGTATYNNQPVQIAIQFRMLSDDRFEVSGFERDGKGRSWNEFHNLMDTIWQYYDTLQANRENMEYRDPPATSAPETDSNLRTHISKEKTEDILGVFPGNAFGDVISLWDDKEAWVAKGDGGQYDVDISIPQVSGLTDQTVQDSVNATLRQAIYAEAGTFESRMSWSENVRNSSDKYGYDYSYNHAKLEEAWVENGILAVYCNVTYGGSGVECPVVLYIDLMTGEQISEQPLFVDSAADDVVNAFAWAAVATSDSFYDLKFQDVQNTEPHGYWLSPKGLTVIYENETLHRRQLDVIIPWPSISTYVVPGHVVYEAVM